MAKRKSGKPKIRTTGGLSTKYSWKIHYILLSILSGILVYFCTSINHIQDDAYITFRYVENFIHGKGLVFNPGELVEGFTSIFWVLILSALALFKTNLPQTSQILSAGSAVLILFITFKISSLVITQEINSKTDESGSSISGKNNYLLLSLRLAPSFLLTFTGAFIYWSVSGMEATFFILVNLLAIYFYINEKEKPICNYGFAISMLLATLARPEGALMFSLILVHYLFTQYFQDSSPGIVGILKQFLSMKNLKFLAIIILPNLALLTFRLLYYGYPFPNTFYAKTGFSSIYFSAGLDYFFDFAGSYLLWGAMLILPLALFRTSMRSIISLFYLLIVVNTIYVIGVGGDVLPFFRFFLPILPLIYIVFSKFILNVFILAERKVSNKLTTLLSIIIVFSMLGIGWFNYTSSQAKIARSSKLEKELVNKMSGSAAWLAKQKLLMEKPLVVAATTIGALSYFSNVTIIDMLGLTDKEIAHNPKYIEEISGTHAGWKERKYNVDYVLSRKPDFIFFSTGIKPSAYAERALFINDEFINNYYPYFFKIWPGLKYIETIYKRRPDSFSLAKTNKNPNYSESYVNTYNNVLNLKPDNTNISKVLELCFDLIEHAPNNFADSYRLLGNTYEKAGNKRLAFESFNKAYNIDQTNGPVNIKLLFHYRALGDTLNVLKHYRALKMYNPEVLSLYGMK